METLGMLRSFVCCCHRSQEGKLCSKWEVLQGRSRISLRAEEGKALLPSHSLDSPCAPGSSHPWLVLGWFGESKS